MYFQLNTAVITRVNITPWLILIGATLIITCSLESRVNLVNDRRPVGEDLDLGYHSLNTAKLTFDAKHALPSG
jgi:hypothetical protein